MADTLTGSAAPLSPRASIARLTLQLRAAVREAEEAERAEQEWDGDAAVAELRGRLEPMLRDQQRAFEVELWRARADAAARVQSVRRELAEAPSAAPPVVVEPEPVVESGPEPVVEPEPVVVVEPEPETEPVVVVEPEPVVVIEPEPESVVVIEPEPVVEPEPEPESVVVIEPEPVVVIEPEPEPVVVIEPEPVVVIEPEPLVAVESEPVVVDVVVVDAADVLPPPAFAPPAPGTAHHAEPTTAAAGSPDPSPHVVGVSHEPAAGTHGGTRDGWSRPAPEQPAPLTADDVRSIVDEAIERFAARQAPPASSGMDPEAFSRAFAAAFGAAFSAMLDERVAALNAGPAVAPPWVRYQAAPPVEVKKSFWTNMWHADVMLSVLAAVIVLVILIAWST